MKRLVVGMVGALFLLAFPSGASACSCAAPESDREAAHAALRHSDLAFIGVLRAVRRIGEPPEPGESAPPGNAFFRYRVIHAYGGDPGRFVRVRSSLSTASCGLSRRKGARTAMGADRARDGALEAGLCSLVSPRALRRAAAEADASGRRGPGC